MVFDPNIGMTPNDWRETEVRREESRQRVHNPYGKEPSAHESDRRVDPGPRIPGIHGLRHPCLGWRDLDPRRQRLSPTDRGHEKAALLQDGFTVAYTG